MCSCPMGKASGNEPKGKSLIVSSGGKMAEEEEQVPAEEGPGEEEVSICYDAD